jgi:hypothetical protein
MFSFTSMSASFRLQPAWWYPSIRRCILCLMSSGFSQLDVFWPLEMLKPSASAHSEASPCWRISSFSGSRGYHRPACHAFALQDP